MIVAPEPLAVEAGAQVLRSGGNAIDAAVTCAFVQSIVNPHSCGVAGYLVACLQLASSPQPSALIVDGPALAGSGVAAAMWEDRMIRPNPTGRGYFLEGKPNDVGYTSICVPGTVKALHEMLERWGTLSWREALEPARRFAQDGFVVDHDLAKWWREDAPSPEASSLLDYVESNQEARRIYLKPDGRPYATGDVLRNPDYARTLERLGEHGPQDFYVGGLADDMLQDLSAHGSFIERRDYATYELQFPHVAYGTYDDATVATTPAPHGGPTFLEILNILEVYDLPSIGHNTPDYILLLGLAMKAGYADRNAYIGDPRFVDIPDMLVSKERARYWRDRIDGNDEFTVTEPNFESRDTTHVSVVDRSGTCVSLTHTLSSSSGVITPGLGFMYNNGMFNFHPAASHPNGIAPGKARLTGQSPTIIYRHGQPELVLGAPGGSAIITSVLQVVLNYLCFGMDISEAVLAPRIDCQLDVIRCEQRIPEYVCEEVRKKHPTERVPFSRGAFGWVHAIAIEPTTGTLSGAADTGAGGMALGV